jgi:hypothetical protein
MVQMQSKDEGQQDEVGLAWTVRQFQRALPHIENAYYAAYIGLGVLVGAAIQKKAHTVAVSTQSCHNERSGPVLHVWTHHE